MKWDTEAALLLARYAHLGQVDKAGVPYIRHPQRVAAYLGDFATEAYGLTDPLEIQDAVQAALLHDVIEDTPLTEEMLLQLGVPERIVGYVVLLTRKDGQSPEDYYRAIAVERVARAVKLADIDDNADPKRLARLDKKTRERLGQKYAVARLALWQHTPRRSAVLEQGVDN